MKKLLVSLADKYEKASFCNEDPSQFLRWYKKSAAAADIETASFIAAMLAFGSRSQFIPKIKQILQTADKSSGSITSWLKTGTYKKDFPTGTKKFYRFYSYDDMHTFFAELASLLKQDGSPGKYFKKQWEQIPEENRRPRAKLNLSDIIGAAFPKSRIVPKGRSSANKRTHMFLRWMVRQNSPVDLGLWKWYPQSLLIIPLDVHVMQEAQKLGLINKKATASRKTAEALTAQLEQAFPADPCRGDYALFGLGVN